MGLSHPFVLPHLFGISTSLASNVFFSLYTSLASQTASHSSSTSHTFYQPLHFVGLPTPPNTLHQPPNTLHRPPNTFFILYTLSASHNFSASHSLVVNTPLGSYTFSISTLVRPSIPFVPQHSGFPVFSLNACGSSHTFLASKLFLASHVQ